MFLVRNSGLEVRKIPMVKKKKKKEVSGSFESIILDVLY